MRRPLLLLLLLLASACGKAPPAHPEIEEDERRLGAEQHPQLLAEFGGAYRAPEAAYVAGLGEKLADVAGLPGQCTFTLVNSDVVNAFAVPGCYIYVTRGLMGIVNSEAELASVLAHELGHIVADHGERQQRRSVLRGIGVAAVGVLTGSERLARMAGNAAQYFTLRYSRGQEYEADDLGIRYLKAAGYDPYAAADMLKALARQESYSNRTRDRDDAKSIPEWVRTHPLTENRIVRARDEAEATGLAPDALPEYEAPYLRQVDGLLFGDDPEQGFVTGRRFAHPVMRIGFEAPPGFTLTNSPQAILIEGPDGIRGEFAGGPLPRGGLDDYAAMIIRQILGGQPAEVGAAERGIVNGLPALVVPIRVQTQQGSAIISLATYASSRGQAYHFLMFSPGNATAGLADLFASFHLLTAAEVASLHPRVIRTVIARVGDTPATLAARMASDHPLDLFLMLNGRTADQPIRPGEPVKIVTLAGR
jgi:predicted Zn-dependent protease